MPLAALNVLRGTLATSASGPSDPVNQTGHSSYVFFASQESSYVTGEVLGVTGGQLLT